jgi:hypothetical protein
MNIYNGLVEMRQQQTRPRAAVQNLVCKLLFLLIFCSLRWAAGVEIGQPIPAFSLPDQNGALQSFQSLKGPNGLMLVFYRSADW